MQPKPDDIQYAIENSHILKEPARRIDTFQSTRFKFIAISEQMDQVGVVRVRSGEMEAQKPAIINPFGSNEVELEGFDDKAKEYIESLRKKGIEPAFFQYGFQFKRTEAAEECVHDSFENVKDRVLEESKKEDDPMLAIIECVDNTWEIGLLKFSIDMIQKSSEINAFDFKRKGLL